MNLYKLIGYDPITQGYINPNTGQKENIPNSPFCVNNSVPDATYADFSSPENWVNYGETLLGSYVGFKDYQSLRTLIYTGIEVIAGADYLNWNNLTLEQKNIALVWCNIRIVNARGIVFYATECGGMAVASSNIEHYLDKSIHARNTRFNAYSNYGFTYMGKNQGLLADTYARQAFMDSTYINRGVVFKSVDGIDGLGDWIQGLESFTVTGLKPRIIAGEFILSGIDVNTFCNNLIGIINDGTY